MVPCTKVELATTCQAIIANDTCLCAAFTHLDEVLERYRHDRDASVAKNATTHGRLENLPKI